MKIDNALYKPGEADIAFLGLNYYKTCGEQGKGPELIRKAMNTFGTYDIKTRKDVFDELKIADLGDFKPKNFEDLRSNTLRLLKQVKGVPVILGGEHLISLPVIEALKPKNVLIFDAHADLFEKYKGNKYSYATVSKRISESADRVIIAGVRDMSCEEAITVPKNVEIVNDVRFVTKKLRGKDWYVSVDLDVLDPVYCPEVSTPIPFGPDLNTLTKVLNSVFLKHNILGLDVVELTSKNPGISSINSAGLIMQFLKRLLK
ncbi:MAG: arginase family protein [Nanoarchaeota archaeon]|nr:arginase family protein [Nanoarchaeota archaeon]